MTELRRSLIFSAAQSYVSVALQLVSTAVLSRILTPAQVGVFAVATVFAALASNVRDFGIAEYLIQAKDLSAERIRAAFAANIITSWSMALAMWLASTPVGNFYHSPQIGDVMRLQCFNFVLIPFGAINMAWFRRELNFKPIFLCGVGADLLSLVVAIVLALRGMGAMSLAWSSLTGVVVTVVVSMALRPVTFPRWPALKGLGEVIRFGSFASVIFALGQLGKGAPEMILGRLLGVTGVALFSRGLGLVQMFKLLVSRAITPVCMPYFAKAVREEGTVRRAYARSVAFFSAVGFTALGFLTLAAFPLIRLVYGPQWDAAVPLARVLCVAGAIELIHVLAKEALISNGSIKPATRLQTLQQIVQVLGLLLVVPFGLIGAAWGMLWSAIVGVALAQWQLRQSAGFTLTELMASCRASLIVAGAALAPMLLLALVMPANPRNYLLQLAIGAVLTTGVWVVAMRLTAHPLWDELTRAAAPLRARLTLMVRHSNGV